MSTIEERYTNAVVSTDLKCDTRDGAPIGDADVMIAAGWSKSRIGSALLRLHTEFDGAAKPKPMQGSSDEAMRHNQTEAMLFFGQLKTLPSLLEQVTLQLGKWGDETPDQTARATLLWWLDKTCPKCQGRKYDVIQGTGRMSAKACKDCHGSGERVIPHGQPGKRMAIFLDECVHRSRQQIGKALHSRSSRTGGRDFWGMVRPLG